ncbi:MAG: c-type cytochrome [Actinomycetota bacterium]
MLLLAGCGGEAVSDQAIKGQVLAGDLGCTNCHSTDGDKSVGPTWKGLAGSQVKLSDGSVVKADDNYLRESIEMPSEKTVDGFKPGLMERVIKPGSISKAQAAQLIAYIKTLN